MTARFVVTAVGVLITVFMAALDQTAVATALAAIGREFPQGGSTAPVVSAYLLSSTLALPILGPIGDRWGHGRVLLGSIIIFCVASAGAAAAPQLEGVVLARTAQGVGGAGLIIGAQAAFADLVPARDRGRYTGLLAVTLALATVCGPLVGGATTDIVGWRGVFVVNVPLGLISLILLWPYVRRSRPPGSIERSRRLGAALTAFGRSFALLRMRKVAMPTLTTAAVAAVMYPVVTYLPSHLQNSKGMDAGAAALFLLPFAGGTVIASATSGLLIVRTGRYRVYPALGAFASAASIVLVAADQRAAPPVLALVALLVGLGSGFAFQNLVVIAQNAVDPRSVGAVTGLLSFSRQLAAMIAVTLAAPPNTGATDSPFLPAAPALIPLAIIGLVAALLIPHIALATKSGPPRPDLAGKAG